MIRIVIVTWICAALLAGSTGRTQTAAITPTPAAAAVEPPATPAATPQETPTAATTDSAPPRPRDHTTYDSLNVDGPYIAMSFDDGPHKTLTPKLLDLLAQRKIKATFFVLGQNVQEYPEIARRIVAEGHEIANHSWSHANLSKLSDSGVETQLQKTNEAIEQATGVKPTLMRPPYGALTKRQPQMITSNGLKVILWSIDPLDWKYRNASRVENWIVSHTKSGDIILSHDIHPTTIEAMPQTLDALQARGFKFVTVTELLALERPPSASPTPAAPPEESPATTTTSSAAKPGKRSGAKAAKRPAK